MTTTKQAKPVRYISRKDCPCGAGRSSALLEGHPSEKQGDKAVFFDLMGFICVACRGCNRARHAEMVRGKISNKHQCGAKCMASRGPSCECSCGGVNHGASYAAT